MHPLRISTLIMFILLLHGGAGAFAQHTAINYVHDTTAIEEMDYQLSLDEFLTYYGTDDSSRAMIHMFFRKRSNAFVNTCVPGASTIGIIALSDGGIFVLPYPFNAITIIGAGIFSIAYLVRGIYQRFAYNKQALLYIIVDRERGHPFPNEFSRELLQKDFQQQNN